MKSALTTILRHLLFLFLFVVIDGVVYSYIEPNYPSLTSIENDAYTSAVWPNVLIIGLGVPYFIYITLGHFGKTSNAWKLASALAYAIASTGIYLYYRLNIIPTRFEVASSMYVQATLHTFLARLTFISLFLFITLPYGKKIQLGKFEISV